MVYISQEKEEEAYLVTPLRNTLTQDIGLEQLLNVVG